MKGWRNSSFLPRLKIDNLQTKEEEDASDVARRGTASTSVLTRPAVPKVEVTTDQQPGPMQA